MISYVEVLTTVSAMSRTSVKTKFVVSYDTNRRDDEKQLTNNKDESAYVGGRHGLTRLVILCYKKVTIRWFL